MLCGRILTRRFRPPCTHTYAHLRVLRVCEYVRASRLLTRYTILNSGSCLFSPSFAPLFRYPLSVSLSSDDTVPLILFDAFLTSSSSCQTSCRREISRMNYFYDALSWGHTFELSIIILDIAACAFSLSLSPFHVYIYFMYLRSSARARARFLLPPHFFCLKRKFGRTPASF